MDIDMVKASLTKNRRTTLERIEKFLSKEYFSDVNLYGRLYSARENISDILHWKVPGSSTASNAPSPSAVNNDSDSEEGDGSGDGPEWTARVPAKEQFVTYKPGEQFGPTWSTHWFILSLNIPAEWIGKEVHLLWDSGSEAMIWQPGQQEPLQGLSGGIDFQFRDCFSLSKKLLEKECSRELWIEVACNDLFGAGAGGMINPPNNNKMFSVKKAQVAVFDRDAFELFTDFEILVGMSKHLPETDPKTFDAMYLANHIVNVMKTQPNVQISEVKKVTRKFFGRKNGDAQHTIFALGHCHIDCAWLWPYDETIRKCGRSWITMVRLMEEYPDFRFVASSAQQFLWVKEYYPVAYDQIKKFVKNGQFIPVGGTWVEMDGNLPSGEAFIRQFFYGQKFFEEEFGKRCDIFWLPDTFGYSAQLPQIMRLAGIKYFLTQKLSWSLVNQFPHHNFMWRGIDGSEVLVHFPPGDSYGMNLTVEDALKTSEKLKDKGRVHQSVLLYGYGDGGGGPTAAMIERGKRMADIDGIPKVVLNESISDFFTELESEKHNLNTWSGELYLELHNATYTTQGVLKRKNREVQNLFRDVEFLEAIIFAFFGIKPQDRRQQWHDFLLQQFHDVLPGSSIGMVNEDARRILSDIAEALSGSCLSMLYHLVSSVEEVMFNATAAEVPYVFRPEELLLQHLPPYSLSSSREFLPCSPLSPTVISKDNDGFLMENNHVKIQLDQFGQITSMLLRSTDKDIPERECIPPGGTVNALVLFDDVPLYWDAWDCMDYHLEARSTQKEFLEANISGDMIVAKFQMSAACHVTQHIKLAPDSALVLVECTVDWREKHKFLKMEVDVNVTSENKRATFEIQHGHIERPAHRNTSWDWAKFEVCCQRWADLSEHGFGVAIINATNHGFAVRDNKMALSLLRAPKAPDAEADMGIHTLKYAIMPHTGTFQEAGVIQRAISLNNVWDPKAGDVVGLTSNHGTGFRGLIKFFEMSNPAVIIDAVKVAGAGNDRLLVIRLYESHGGAASCMLKTSFPVTGYQECTILEDSLGDKVLITDPSFNIRLRAFEIKSFLLYLSGDVPRKFPGS